jgi:hypothetical protein
MWCGEPGCESEECIARYARSRWIICPDCEGLSLGGDGCLCVSGVVEVAPIGEEQPSGCVQLGEVTVRLFDRGPEPEWNKDRSLFGPWYPYEAELAGDEHINATGWTPRDAIRGVLDRQAEAWCSRWPAIANFARVSPPHTTADHSSPIGVVAA